MDAALTANFTEPPQGEFPGPEGRLTEGSPGGVAIGARRARQSRLIHKILYYTCLVRKVRVSTCHSNRYLFSVKTENYRTARQVGLVLKKA
jgi:hypothetical protein